MSIAHDRHEPPARTILIAEADRARQDWLHTAVQATGEVHAVADSQSLLAALARHIQAGTSRPCVIIVGRGCLDASADELLATLAGHYEDLRAHSISVFLAADESRDLQGVDVPESIAIEYGLHRGLSADHLRVLIERATSAQHGEESALVDRAAAASLTRILDVARNLAAIDSLERVTKVLQDAVCDVSRAERGYCLFHDAERSILWSEDEGDDRAEEVGAFLGLSGFAARTGAPAYAERATEDPLYHRAIDDPVGDGGESICAQPVLDSSGSVHAVLVAIRSSTPFSVAERARLGQLAEYVAAGIHQLALRTEAEAVIQAESEDMFRREAVDAYVSRGRSGDVVRVSPPWVRWAYWLLLVLLAMGTVYLIVGRVDEYSVGPSVVRMSGRSDVTAHVSGKIVAVEVEPGQRVVAGQILARLYDAAEAAEVQRFERDLHAQLRARMLDPADMAARQAVSSLREDLRRARSRLEERTVRAPSAGTVADIRVQASQHVSPGDLIASLVGDDTELSVIALLPGADRPKLHLGMSLRMELAGYRYAYQDLIIHKVSDEIIGPAEARRYLGKRLADGIPVIGSVVVVEAKLPARAFDAHGQRYPYYDGMLGRAEVRTRERRIIVALIPSLEEL